MIPTWLLLWPKKENKVSDKVPVNTEDTDLLYKQTGQGRYRVYLNKYGKYVGQRKVSSGRGLSSHFYPDTNEYWEDVEQMSEKFGFSHAWCDTPEEAVKACEKDAAARKVVWERERKAGVVMELGRLP